jgi:hypothetical protein
MYKKIVSGLLTLCLVAGGAVGLSAVGGPAEGSVITASAEEYLTYGDYEYTLLSDGTVEIISYIGDDTAVNIPSKLNGKTVTSIGNAAFRCDTNITSVVIPNTVTNIRSAAFEECYALKGVVIPGSVTTIGIGAFESCYVLTSVTISEGVKTIESDAFYGCEKLKSLTIPSSVTSIVDDAFEDCTGLTSISVDKNNKNYTSVDGVLFNKDKTVLMVYPAQKTGTSYSIPSGVKTINANAFWCAKKLTSITIPDSVTFIGQCAFYSCEKLKSITIPKGVTSIADSMFYCCYALTTITISDSVTSIGSGAFSNCTSLKSITIPDSVTTMGDDAFSFCSALTSITLSNNLNDIDYMTFYSCTSLKSIVIPNGVKTVGWGAFGECSSLASVTLPNTVTEIADLAFFECPSLKTVMIPKSVTSIGMEGFDSKSLKTINCYLGSFGETYAKNHDISYKLLDHTHSYKTKVVKPTTSSKGYTLKTCSSCGDEIKSNYTAKLIAMSKCKATISKSSYAYTGKAIKPTVTVKYGSTKLKKGTDYTVSYKNNTKTGKATITIKGKGKYSGTITKTFNIVPKKATLSSVKSPKTKTVKVTWKKDSQATGYQIVYSTSSKFKSSKTVNISKNSTTSKTISKLTKGKTYYVKVRSYKTIDGKKVYGAYSTVKKIKCK